MAARSAATGGMVSCPSGPRRIRKKRRSAPESSTVLTKTWRTKLRIFCDEPHSSPLARLTSFFLTVCIILSVVMYVLSSQNMQSQELYTPCALTGEKIDKDVELYRHEILKERYCFEVMKEKSLYANDSAVSECDEDKWLNNECEAQVNDKYNDMMWDFWIAQKAQDQSCIPPPNNMRRKILAGGSIVGSQKKAIYCENTFPSFIADGEAFWFAWNSFFTCVFVIEIFVRFVASKTYCRESKDERDSDMLGTKPFFLDFFNIVDILAIMPWFIRIPYYTIFERAPSPIVSAFGFLKVFRMFKILRHFEGTSVFFHTFKSSFMPLLVSFSFLLLMFIILSFTILLFESCIDKGCTFTDPMNTGYYLSITVLTVGYGDQVPANWAARFVGIFIMIMGSFYLAMPLAIIGNKFDQAYTEDEQGKNKQKEEEILTWNQTKKRIVTSSYQLLSLVSKMGDLQQKHDEAEGLSAISFRTKMEESCSHYRLLHNVMKKDINRVFFHKKPTVSRLLQKGESKKEGLVEIDADAPAWVFPPGYSVWVALHREVQPDSADPVYSFSSENGAGTRHLEDGMPISCEEDKPGDPPGCFTERFNKRTCKLCRSKNKLGMFDKLSIVQERDSMRLEYAEKRAQKGSCADKVYVLMDGPRSNSGTRACSRLRAVVSVLSICVCILQTTGFFNIYGPTEPHCVKQALAWCNSVEIYGNAYQYDEVEKFGNVKDQNKNCYPQKCCDSSEDNDIPALLLPRNDKPGRKACLKCAPGWTNITYGGMLKKNSAGKWVSRSLEEIKHNGYPFTHRGLLVDIACSTETSEGPESEPDQVQPFTTIKKSTTRTTGEAPFAEDYMSKKLMAALYFGAISFCKRRQCLNNAYERTGLLSGFGGTLQKDFTDWNNNELKQEHINTMWAYFELVFCVFFLLEFVLRVSATSCQAPKPSYPRGPLPPDATGGYTYKNITEYRRAVAQALPGLKEFFSNMYNLLDLVTMVCCILELVFVTSELGAFEFEPWGIPFIPFISRSVLRPLRVVVMGRFVSIQRSTHGFRVLRLTITAVLRRLGIPVMFLILLSILFAGSFYTAETIINCRITSKSVFEESSEIVWEFPNVTSGIPKGQRCQLQTMFDAWWLSFVTLTTVGYGRLYPITSLGKAVAMATSVMGTLYMAMPLSIVGNKFYDVYKRLEEMKKRPMLQKLKKYARLVRSFNKTGSLLKRLKSLKTSSLLKEEPEQNILDHYKEDIHSFCNTRVLTSIETVDRDSIAEVQARLERVIEYVAQDYSENAHKIETRVQYSF